MIKRDYVMIMVLILLAVFVWVRNLTWVAAAEDTLPILVALPLFLWLGRPWTFVKEAFSLPIGGSVLSVFCFLAGILTDITLFLAVGWTALLWCWLSTRLLPEARSSTRYLLVLPLLAFPWITLDGEIVGWWFRLSSAWVSAQVFSLLGFEVIREGTQLLVKEVRLNVGAPCSGLNVLQSMLIAGTVMVYVTIGRRPSYWLGMGLLIVIAWFSNVIRILVICVAALTLGPEFASGFFHDWGGWLVLILMFSLCCFVFMSWNAPSHRDSATL